MSVEGPIHHLLTLVPSKLHQLKRHKQSFSDEKNKYNQCDTKSIVALKHGCMSQENTQFKHRENGMWEEKGKCDEGGPIQRTHMEQCRVKYSLKQDVLV